MREILFRGKDIRGNWHIGLLAHIGNAWYISNKMGIATACEVIPDTIGQYTGLTDKNGEKIFEGDIVKYKSNPPCRIYYIGCEFVMLWDKFACNFEQVYYDEIEVIGNVYDNHELLEVKE